MSTCCMLIRTAWTQSFQGVRSILFGTHSDRSERRLYRLNVNTCTGRYRTSHTRYEQGSRVRRLAYHQGAACVSSCALRISGPPRGIFGSPYQYVSIHTFSFLWSEHFRPASRNCWLILSISIICSVLHSVLCTFQAHLEELSAPQQVPIRWFPFLCSAHDGLALHKCRIDFCKSTNVLWTSVS